MSISSPDNRMSIFRFFDHEFSKDLIYKQNYVFASDKRITGEVVINGPSGQEIFRIRGWQLEEDRDGLYKYLVTFTTGVNLNSDEYQQRTDEYIKQFHEDGDLSKPLIKKEGYNFHGDKEHEIACILSFVFQARFYFIFQFDDYTKTDYQWNFRLVNKVSHPTIFNVEGEERNFNREFLPFIEELRNVNQNHHKKIAFALYFYREALHSINLNDNILLTHLVSSIEALLDEERNLELISKLKDILEEADGLTASEKTKVYGSVQFSGVTKAFVEFVFSHSINWEKFSEGNNSNDFKIARESSTMYSLKKTLERIYKARSAFLHSGTPVLIDRPFIGDGDGHFSFSGGRLTGNTSYLEEEKLPYMYVLDDIVRASIKHFIQTLD